MKNIFEISIKELKSQLDHLGGYLLISLFLGVLYFFFLRTFFLTNIASLRGMFQLIPWILAIFVPAITMGSIAHERDKQTLEYLITKPIRSIELVLGKVVGSGLFVALSLFLTLPLVGFIASIGNLDLGETATGYLGSIFLIIALVSIGVMVSSFFKNQIPAFLVSTLIIVLLNIMNTQFISINIPIKISTIIGQMSIVDRYSSIIRGVIEFRDIVYFTILTIVSIAIAFLNIERIRVPNVRKMYKKFIIIIFLTAVMGSGLIYSTQFAKGRIDLTSNKKYSISQATKDVLNKDGKISIDVYISDDLPPQFQVIATELKNILNDYKISGGNNIEVNYNNPKDTEIETKLQKLGIRPIQFNLIGKDQFKIQQAYLAVVINIEGDSSKREIIDFVGDVDNIEYELTSRINKMKNEEQPKIAFASGAGEKSIYTDYNLLRSYLENDYDIETVTFETVQNPNDDKNANKKDKSSLPDLSQYKLLIIADPQDPYAEESITRIETYLENAGNIIFLADTVNVQPQILSATIKQPNPGALFQNYGVTVKENLVYDTVSNLPVTLSSGTRSIIVSYPFYVKALKNKDAPITQIPESITLLWPNTLSLSDERWQVIYSTSENAHVQEQEENFNINPQQAFNSNKGQKYPLAAMLTTEKNGKLLVVSNTEFLGDNYIKGGQENIVFITRAIEYMTQGKGLSEIKAKDLFTSYINLATPQQKIMIKYAAPGTSLALLLGIGLIRITRRKRLIKRYKQNT